MGQNKTIRKTTAVLHYSIFDTKMFVNSGALSLLRNIFRTCLVSMATSRLICISANALKLFLPIDAWRYLMLDATIPKLFKNAYIFGYESMLHTFNAFATELGWFLFGTVFHRLSHLEYSSKAFPGVVKSWLYSWIISSI